MTKGPFLPQRRTIAVTGASGFVGRAVIAAAAAAGHSVRGLYRNLPQPAGIGESLVTGDLGAADLPGEALAGVDTVIHLAARTHALHEMRSDRAAYERINVTGTRHLARAAADAGVRRLVYLSSVKVNGEHTPIDAPFTEQSISAPEDAYGQTKWEAEQLLRDFGREAGIEIVVLRPPLVYGPGVKGNLRRLIRLVASGLPLPLASVRNKRSMIGLENLVSAILAAADHPAAAGRTFLVSDQHDLSTPELLTLIAAGMNRPVKLMPFPVGLLRAGGALTGHGGDVERLTASSIVDSSAITRELGWRPGVAIEEGLRRMLADER